MSVTAISSTHPNRFAQRPALRRIWPVAFAVALGASACAGSTGSPAASGSSACKPQAQCVLPTGSSTASEPSASTAPGGGAPVLLVLADGVDGGTGLWGLDAAGKWTAVGPVADGRAIARNDSVITIARAGSLETRSTAKPAETAGTVQLKWPVSAPSAPIVAIDRSPSGSIAVVAADTQSMTYVIAATDGTVIPLQGAPTESFTPLVGWVDANRVMVLSQGNDETSRIAVVNLSTQTTATVKNLRGVRAFALSQDRLTVAAVTESAVYLGQVPMWLGGEQPSQIVQLAPSQIVWQLVLDQTGTHLAMLSGTEAADGTVGDIHELGYTKTTSGWTKTYDAAVPFTRSLGQAWLG